METNYDDREENPTKFKLTTKHWIGIVLAIVLIVVVIIICVVIIRKKDGSKESFKGGGKMDYVSSFMKIFK